MKLIFVLILIVGIMAWYFKPSKTQDAASSGNTTVQTQESKTPAGKAIWDGKLSVDENTADELLERPHSELSAEEAALKTAFMQDYFIQTKDLTKYLECLTASAREKVENDIKIAGGIDKFWARESSSPNSQDVMTYTVVSSIEKGNSALVMIAGYLPSKPPKDGTRTCWIYDMYKNKRGWVTNLHVSELITQRPIKIDGKYCGRFMLGVNPDGTIQWARQLIGKRGQTKKINFTDNRITVDALLESLMK